MDMSKTYKLLMSEKDNPKVQLLLSNLDFFDLVCNFILERDEFKNYDFKTLSKLSNDESFLITNSILSTFNSEYPRIMSEYTNDNRLIITDESKKLMGSGSAFIDKDDKIKIRLGLHGDIFDPFLITHEFMHSLNENNKRSLDREILTEGFAIYSEYLLSDYLEKNNINTTENTELLKLRLFTFTERIKSLKEYINNIRELNLSNEQPEDAEIDIFDKMNFLSTIQYTFGNILSLILYKRNQEGLFDNSEYSKLNEDMKTSTNLEIFKKLFPEGLEFTEFVTSYEEAIKFINKENIPTK